jgi:hypothetical protein
MDECSLFEGWSLGPGWSSLLSNLPTLSGAAVDDFVNRQSDAKDKSVREHKFLIESFIHDAQGTVGSRYGPNTMYCQ